MDRLREKRSKFLQPFIPAGRRLPTKSPLESAVLFAQNHEEMRLLRS